MGKCMGSQIPKQITFKVPHHMHEDLQRAFTKWRAGRTWTTFSDFLRVALEKRIVEIIEERNHFEIFQPNPTVSFCNSEQPNTDRGIENGEKK